MKGFLFAISLLIFSGLLSQKVDLHLSEEKIQVGEKFRLIYSIESSQKIDSIPLPIHSRVFPTRKTSFNEVGERITSNYELEVLDIIVDTIVEENNSFIISRIYELTAWDSARVVFVPETIYLNDSIYEFPAKMIEVGMPKTDPTQEIYDINELFSVFDEDESSFLSKYGWIGAALILVASTIVFFLVKRKRLATSEIVELPIRERYMLKIDKLFESELYETDLKAYYVELSIILRRFLSENYDIKLMEKTTTEILITLKGLGLKKETIEDTDLILNQSDLVKFAKSKPPVSDIYKISEKAKSIVVELSPLSEEKVDE